jgi:multiple sugar transport system substrate-binding protein
MVQPFGADYCANADCTELQMTDPKVVEAIQWWADMVQQDRSTLYDPYGGSQTGVPGDPFIAGKAAMGFNGFFAVGQLNQQTQIDYDILQPFKGRDGKRYSILSVQGYQISATSRHKPEAWALIRTLTEENHLAAVWGRPGHFIPALRSAAASIMDAAERPKNQQALLDTLEYAQIQKPFTASAFEAYGKTAELFVAALKGDKPVADALEEINTTANEILKRDRAP